MERLKYVDIAARTVAGAAFLLLGLAAAYRDFHLVAFLTAVGVGACVPPYKGRMNLLRWAAVIVVAVLCLIFLPT